MAIILSTNSTQTLAPNESLSFDRIVFENQSGCASICKRFSTSVEIDQCGFFDVYFQANVSGEQDATPVELSLVMNGSTLPETTAISTPATTTDINNISGKTFICNECCCTRLSVTNTGTSTIIVQAGASILISR